MNLPTPAPYIDSYGLQRAPVIIDELPTIYFRGLDNLIATARSNKVAVCLGFQDFSQLIRDYGDKEAKVIQNTVGNIFSGQVVGETAKSLSERFGKVLQKRQSMTINRNDKSTSISTQLDSLIPASKISTLTQGLVYALLSYGVYITYKILDFPDLTVDGSFPLGAAVTALMMTSGINPWLTLPASLLAG